MLGGSLFAGEFLSSGIRDLPEWSSLDDPALDAFAARARDLLSPFLGGAGFSEAETEQKLVFPLLEALGWGYLPQVKLGPRRENIPDALLYASPAEATAALASKHGNDRYRRAIVVEETKAWELPLDHGQGRTPANQALHYLDLAARLSEGAVRWGLLTNGRLWRLYWQDARSRAEGFLEADLAWLATPAARDTLKTFLLLFRRDAFLPDAEGRSFLLRALDSAREFEERITEALSRAVFEGVYPALLAALSAADPEAAPHDPAWMVELRDAALVLLYRLLFLLYAEDRDLLPAEHRGYAPLSLTGIRRELRQAVEHEREPGAGTAWWRRFAALCGYVDTGNDRMGLPPYNGGLFAAGRAKLLDRLALTDADFAPILRGLSLRETGAGPPAWINYRDLSVQQLGTIYEALLERGVRAEAGRVVPVPDDGARHTAGVYYTRSAALVRFTLGGAVDPLLAAARDAFAARLETLAGDRRPAAQRCADLARFDPAEAMLRLRILDPAMGSGHFLVTLADHMADAILAAMAEAADAAEEIGYVSPLAAGIAQERDEIEGTARTRGWAVKGDFLGDRQIVRRLVLKRVLHGVDLNPLAVELAKLSLWLHSFTVGAPLSFLDHHLRVGDSLLGAGPDELRELVDAAGKTRKGSALHLAAPLREARSAALSMRGVELLTDADIAQVYQSQQHFADLERGTAPLRAFLDAMNARDFLPKLPKPEAKARAAAESAWLDDVAGDPVALAGGAAPRDVPQASAIAGLLATLRPISQARRFLHWPVAFPNIWRDLTGEGGFDAVVGNPPYVRQEAITAIKPALKARYAEVHDGVADLYVYFFAAALRLLRPGGRLAFVVNNKWLRAGYAEALRGRIAGHAWLEAVTDFGHAKAFFPGVDAFPSVVCIRRPDPAEAAPEAVRVAAVPRDLVRPDALAEQVAAAAFPLPRAAFTREAWVLEPPDVRALMAKLSRVGVKLRDYAGAAPYRGVLTGLNEAFVVDQATRDRLVAEDPRSADLLRRFLRGQDIERWASDWAGLWMIVLKSSGDHPWPWAGLAEADAETCFAREYPTLHRHLSAWRDKLRAREDQGRFWWELRSCAYYDQFDRPKLIYQEIQYHPAYALDRAGHYLNNKAFLLAANDPFLLAALNSPLLWWFNWRHLARMKDEALTPQGFRMVEVPIPRPDHASAAQAATLADALAATARARHAAVRALRAWYAAEWGIAKPPGKLGEPFALDAPGFATALRAALPAAGRRLSAAAIAHIHAEHAATVAPLAARLAEAGRHERALSRLVNAAFGLTPEEEALMWRTAPPRMPVAPEGGE
ncbi:MAG TPA: Eco57I restriction-modification methylase domain-containing protein [Falsiroseomonas sp.]|jgi:hypothetical protein|nr:Eco57I restriction-modification methylase domain-containing protein [Falsiroseomonas sp.]